MSEYGKKLMGYLGAASAINCLAMARELGVVQLLSEASTPLTSHEVAEKLDLKERYVREMLATLAVGEVISVDDTSSLYHVPEKWKPELQEMSVYARYFPVFGQRFPAVQRSYRKSGPQGVRYSEFPGLFSVLNEVLETAKKDILDLDILPVVPDIINKLESGITVADFGCSTGILLNKLAVRFPNSSFIGGDVAVVALDNAKREASSKNLQNVTYEIYDLTALPESFSDKIDWIYSRDVIHDLPYPQKALSEIYRSLKPGGVFSLIDIGMSGEVVKELGNPLAMFYYAASCMLCLCESYQYADSAALGTGWGRPLTRQMVRKAGFTILKENVSHYDPMEVHYVCQK